MKKLLLLLLFIPLISFGQETEKVYLITTKSGKVIKSKNYRINEDKGIVDIQKLDGKFIRFKTFNIATYVLLENKVDATAIKYTGNKANEEEKIPPFEIQTFEEFKKDLRKKEQEAINSVWDNWSEGEYVDDFGDKTGEKYKYMTTTDGVFSNSAANNSKLSGQFSTASSSLTIDILEYGTNKANSTDATFEVVKIKQPDGNIVSIKKVFFTKGGSLYFSKDKFKQVSKALSLKGDYTMIFNRSGNYSQSRYRLKFSM